MLGLTGPVRMSTTEIDDRRCDDFTEGRPCACAGSELVALTMGGSVGVLSVKSMRSVKSDVDEVKHVRDRSCFLVVSRGIPPHHQWVCVASEKMTLPYTRVHPWPSNSWLT